LNGTKAFIRPVYVITSLELRWGDKQEAHNCQGQKSGIGTGTGTYRLHTWYVHICGMYCKMGGTAVC